MRVQLLSHTPDPFWLVVRAARTCYASESTNEKSDALLFLAMLRRSETPLEHAVFTFSISDVSRVLTHQLVRHRIASFNQLSQRYVESDCRFHTPSLEYLSGETRKHVKDRYGYAYAQASDHYFDLLALGVKREDARYILPSGAFSNLIMTMNLRELARFFSLRLSLKAQKEIQDLARLILSLVVSCFPIELAEGITDTLSGRVVSL